MTGFDAVASVGMNELSSYQRAGRAAKYPHGHPNHLQALFALPGQQQANGCYFGGGLGRPVHRLPRTPDWLRISTEGESRISKCPLPPYHPALHFPSCFTGKDQFSSQLITST